MSNDHLYCSFHDELPPVPRRSRSKDSSISSRSTTTTITNAVKKPPPLNLVSMKQSQCYKSVAQEKIILALGVKTENLYFFDQPFLKISYFST